MSKRSFPAAAEGMSIDSRRNFLKRLGLAGAIASTGAASVGAREMNVQAAALSDEKQLETCLTELESILGRMHPLVTEITHGYYPQDDGTFRFWVHCKREFLEYTGPGLYRVSEGGHIMTWWLDKVEERTLSGKIYGHSFTAYMYLEDEGCFINEVRRMWEPKIVEKLELEGGSDERAL